MGNVVVHTKTIADDVIELSIQSFRDNLWHFAFKAIHAHSCVMTDLSQLVIRTFNRWWEGSIRHRTIIFQFIKQFMRVFNNNLINEFRIFQPCEFLFHLIGKTDMLLGILCLEAQCIIADIERMSYPAYALGHDIHIAEDLFFFAAIVCITIRNDWLIEFFSHADNAFHNFFESVHRWHIAKGQEDREVG